MKEQDCRRTCLSTPGGSFFIRGISMVHEKPFFKEDYAVSAARSSTRRTFPLMVLGSSPASSRMEIHL